MYFLTLDRQKLKHKCSQVKKYMKKMSNRNGFQLFKKNK